MTAPLPASAGVIGWPVAHSKSPLIHRFWLSKLGLDGDYGRFPVRSDRLDQAIRALPALGLRGVNVTVPHKQAVMPLLDRLDPAAETIGAVNTIVVEEDGLVGYNTDAAGFAEPLPPIDGRTALVIGAGGAARAVIAALAERGAARIDVINRDADKAARLLAELGATGEAHVLGQAARSAYLLVNASSLGMVGQPPLPDLTGNVEEGGVVYDLVYAPLQTALLEAAATRGLRTIDGLAMLIGQAAVAFEKFFGAPAPRRHDAELRALLTA